MLWVQSKKLVMWCFLVAVALTVQLRPASGGMVVLPGYDLLYTVSANYNFNGAGGLHDVEFVGVPIGAFDFGAGAVNTGATDTIIRRIGGVSLPDYPPKVSSIISIEMVALSLQSKNAIDWSGFGGVNTEFVKTVNVVDMGSTMTIYNDFTFDSTLKISFGLQGLTSGVIVSPPPKTFTLTGASWSHTPSSNNPNPVLIPGVNWMLNGLNGENDFFSGFALHDAGDGRHGTVDINAVVPEPSSVVVFGLGLLGAGFVVRKRPRKVNAC